MKKQIILFVIMVFGGLALMAQAPPTPPSSANQGGTGPVGGGGAPIGSGMVLLIAMAAGYGGKKVYQARKKLDE
jgi:hypothetical protein